MSKANNLTDFLIDIADAIRDVGAITEEINPQLFSDEIRNLKLGDLVVNIQSETTLLDEDLKKMKEKKNRLQQAIKNTTIDGEPVYKITSQQTQSQQTIDTLFYTKEGDANGYYYSLDSDDYVSKLPLKYEVIIDTDNEMHSRLYNLFSNISMNGDSVTSITYNGSDWIISNESGDVGVIKQSGRCDKV